MLEFNVPEVVTKKVKKDIELPFYKIIDHYKSQGTLDTELIKITKSKYIKIRNYGRYSTEIIVQPFKNNNIEEETDMIKINELFYTSIKIDKTIDSFEEKVDESTFTESLNRNFKKEFVKVFHQLHELDGVQTNIEFKL